MAVLFAASSPAFAAASDTIGQARLTPADIEKVADSGGGRGTSGLAGLRTKILYGDPASPGPYTIEISVPPHTRIAGHTHCDNRTAVVVSGQWFFGYGTVNSEAQLKPLPPGSFYTEPAGSPHFALTRDQPAVVYVTGQGPTDTHFTEAR